jgi:TrmH family RNA methyltransferase
MDKNYISSATNQTIKNLILLQNKSQIRKKEKIFIVEGIKMFKEISEEKIVSVFLSESFARANEKLVKPHYFTVKDEVFAKISDTVTPQGIITIVRQNEYNLENVLKKEGNKLFLILENLQDPGNMGTIIRTAEGAGVDAVIMGKNSVDIYNPKVVRSTMGSIFRVPIIISEDLFEEIDKLKENDVFIYAAHLDGKNYYDDENYNCSSAFLIGNEANGLSEEISKKADKLVKIPMQGKVESLNAAVSAAILMYEASKKMRENSDK